MDRYRVNANVGGLHVGDVVEVDPEHEHWQAYIDAGFLQRHVEPELPELDAADEQPEPSP